MTPSRCPERTPTRSLGRHTLQQLSRPHPPATTVPSTTRSRLVATGQSIRREGRSAASEATVSLSHRAEAVAQTPDGLTRALLMVGSKMPKVVARAWRALLDPAAPTALHSRYGERSPASRRRVYATASAKSDTPTRGQPGQLWRRLWRTWGSTCTEPLSSRSRRSSAPRNSSTSRGSGLARRPPPARRVGFNRALSD